VSTNKVPTYNLVTVPTAGIGVLGDGKERPGTWVGPTLTGNPKNVRSKQSELDVDPGSTPYRAGQPASGPTQPFVSDLPLSSLIGGGTWNKTWNIGFQEASLPSSLWKATPTWFFTADFKTTTITSVTINWKTGAMTAKTTTTYVQGTAECVGKPLSVSVNRARNTR